MSKLRLNFACGPYDRTQALRDGTITGRRRRAQLPHHAARRDLLAAVAVPGVRRLRDVAVELHDAGGERKIAVHRHPGLSVAGVPPRLFLRQHRQGHQERRRPQGQARRRAGIFDDRRGLHARADAARVRREAVRRRMGAGPPRPARPQAAGRHQADAGAGRHRARRPAGARRDRFHDDGEQSAVVPPRLAEGGAAVSELRRDGEGLLPAHQDLSDHAHGGDQARRSSTAIPGWRSISTRRSAAPRSTATSI